MSRYTDRVAAYGISSREDSPTEFRTLHIQNLLTVPLGFDEPALQSLAVERWLLHGLLRLLQQPPVQFRLWDGAVVKPEGVVPRFTLSIADRKSIYQLLSNPSLAFGDLYSAGRLEVEGDLVQVMEVLYHAMNDMRIKAPSVIKTVWRDHAPRSTALGDARENVHHHYDLGNDFYRLWLDEQAMQYTCAYYESPRLTLEQAQVAKMEHVCRKLMLKPGMRVVEAGSGWGGLACYMAREHGVQVVSYNISLEQVAYAHEVAKQQGLSDKVVFVEDDYRNIEGEYDRFVSVGMLEHVGVDHYAELAEIVQRCLKPDGVGLIHTIGRNKPARMNSWIEKRIFPGAYPPSIVELMKLFEEGTFSVLDVENLRLHYAQTLEHWLQRYDRHLTEIHRMYDGAFVRAWRLYLAGSIAAFRVGSLQLFQVVFTHENNNVVPRNRAHLQAERTAAELFGEEI